MKNLKRLLVIIFAGIFIYSGVSIALYLYDGYTSSKINDRMQQQYAEASQVKQAEQSTTNGTEQNSSHLMQQYKERFDSLLEVNAEIVGWISIPGTSVDYPVVKHTDNDYYLNHNIEKQKSSRGAIFMDYRNENVLEETHTVIYGHHMKDGSMFGELSEYKKEDYFKEHAFITFDALEQPTKWQIFSVYVYPPDNQFFKYEFESEQEYSDYLNKIVDSSIYSADVEVTTDDQLLTLVTCTYEVSDARFIVHAKRVE
ncbi:SrtB family sortase [Paenibacillus montaniterrae]|uniref:SrtB family sortase n=1 Tax=Paenibacillus montaniterrae TaxID=429341 RepID=A0A919YW92_9BACL|nr:class B sortase [Paenibacillus montaniterrae]GIP19649.1 SrtB family sortase [Paenibacillus montaniterrae]